MVGFIRQIKYIQNGISIIKISHIMLKR